MNDSDKLLLAKTVLEITSRYKLITSLLSNQEDEILKHLAASSIHMTMFMKDFYNSMGGDQCNIDKDAERKFFEQCGCQKLDS